MAYEKSKQDSYKVKPFGSRGIASKRRSKSLLKENPSGFYNGLSGSDLNSNHAEAHFEANHIFSDEISCWLTTLHRIRLKQCCEVAWGVNLVRN
jgi:hypothetical protein